ncbi:MAG: hypothetical protein WCC58_03535, partial [Burkholderiales bacterium]
AWDVHLFNLFAKHDGDWIHQRDYSEIFTLGRTIFSCRCADLADGGFSNANSDSSTCFHPRSVAGKNYSLNL